MKVLTEDTEYTDKVIIHALFPESDKEMLKKKITEATSGRVMTQGKGKKCTLVQWMEK